MMVVNLELAFNMPGPGEVFQAIVDAASGQEFYATLGITLRRTLIAWGVAFITAVPLAMWTARAWVVDSMLRPWMLIGLTLPSPVVILFVVLLFGLTEMTAVLSLVIIVIPFMANIVH
jgi:ABC-type nitrate/sulfonate/bicarbonate transport system permease component